MSGYSLAFLVGVCLALGVFFSGAETVILAADRAVLKGRTRNHSRRTAHLLRFMERPQQFLAVAWVGETICLAGAMVVAVRFARFGPEVSSLGRASLILVPACLLTGVFLAKVFFLPRANPSVSWMVVGLRFFSLVFSPLLYPLMGFLFLVQKALGRGESQLFFSRDELKLLLTAPSASTDLDQEGRQMIDRVFEFGETVVEEVMIPLVQVEALEETATVGEALRRISQHMYSRYPVYRERIDNVVGILETADLLGVDDLFAAIQPWSRPARYVPFSKPVDELLYAMQRQNFSFAVVVDEYGGCIGVITREDIVEEIVGEIEDEHDQPITLYRRLDPDRVEVNPRMEIDDANEILDWDLPEGEYETVGGFLLTLFRRVPRTGERIRYRDLVFTIKQASPRTIQELIVETVKPRNPKDPEAGTAR